MRIEDDIKLDYSNVLFKPKRSTLTTRKEVNLKRSFKFKHSNIEYNGIPIMAANMDGVGTSEMAKALMQEGLMTCLTKSFHVQDYIDMFNFIQHKPLKLYANNNIVYCLGMSADDMTRFAVVHANIGDKIKYVCIDVANGYTQRFIEYVRNFRSHYPDVVLMAGNVVTADQTQELILNGADIVKVGIGPGSVCTTRIQTGVGYPQLSAVIECADAAHGLGAHIIADGGCTCPGDVAKAFGGGADFVMIGGMLAGHDEGGGDIVINEHITSQLKQNDEKGSRLFHGGSEAHRVTEIRKSVQFYGMSSKTANEKHFGGLDNYRSAEGKVVKIPYKGPVKHTIQDILGGIRSTCTYIGAKNLKQLSKCTTFIRCNDTHNRVYE